MNISKSNKIQVHYFFSDNSHGFDAVVRNECEKELLHIFHDIAKTLDIKLLVQSEPPKEGGFIEFWKFIGENSNQVTIIISAIAIILSRKPVENKKLTELQIENLELENELKRNELKELHLKSLNENDIDEKLIIKVVDLLSLNYKIIWRRSNFYKKISVYKRINKFSSQRYYEDKPIGNDREISRGDFHNFMLLSDELPESEMREAKIDLISPVLKSGNFLWKGFLNNEIISFEMQDNLFKSMIQNGEMILNNKVIINALTTQNRKIDENGQIKIIKTKVKLVIDYSINGANHITTGGQNYLDNK
ncbi:hypothetical protein FNW52_15950 [Flavobacterium sp. ZT3R18]|uniref:hypothetical protein n=1 Tax=Flavobacterium sp. ZT3R18 TaxID=2594429 RepID=UPI00117A7370|nr:hypothetical protein [Flavobacterium sp. ZT3R18]TRX33250.1 hypothetical protein FNW52_15950 [Flavobacterium sp. ZT3R18]